MKNVLWCLLCLALVNPVFAQGEGDNSDEDRVRLLQVTADTIGEKLLTEANLSDDAQLQFLTGASKLLSQADEAEHFVKLFFEGSRLLTVGHDQEHHRIPNPNRAPIDALALYYLENPKYFTKEMQTELLARMLIFEKTKHDYSALENSVQDFVLKHVSSFPDAERTELLHDLCMTRIAINLSSSTIFAKGSSAATTAILPTEFWMGGVGVLVDKYIELFRGTDHIPEPEFMKTNFSMFGYILLEKLSSRFFEMIPLEAVLPFLTIHESEEFRQVQDVNRIEAIVKLTPAEWFNNPQFVEFVVRVFADSELFPKQIFPKVGQRKKLQESLQEDLLVRASFNKEKVPLPMLEALLEHKIFVFSRSNNLAKKWIEIEPHNERVQVFAVQMAVTCMAHNEYAAASLVKKMGEAVGDPEHLVGKARSMLNKAIADGKFYSTVNEAWPQVIANLPVGKINLTSGAKAQDIINALRSAKEDPTSVTRILMTVGTARKAGITVTGLPLAIEMLNALVEAEIYPEAKVVGEVVALVNHLNLPNLPKRGEAGAENAYAVALSKLVFTLAPKIEARINDAGIVDKDPWNNLLGLIEKHVVSRKKLSRIKNTRLDFASLFSYYETLPDVAKRRFLAAINYVNVPTAEANDFIAFCEANGNERRRVQIYAPDLAKNLSMPGSAQLLRALSYVRANERNPETLRSHAATEDGLFVLLDWVDSEAKNGIDSPFHNDWKPIGEAIVLKLVELVKTTPEITVSANTSHWDFLTVSFRNLFDLSLQDHSLILNELPAALTKMLASSEDPKIAEATVAVLNGLQRTKSKDANIHHLVIPAVESGNPRIVEAGIKLLFGLSGWEEYNRSASFSEFMNMKMATQGQPRERKEIIPNNVISESKLTEIEVAIAFNKLALETFNRLNLSIGFQGMLPFEEYAGIKLGIEFSPRAKANADAATDVILDEVAPPLPAEEPMIKGNKATKVKNACVLLFSFS